ncbi:MAG: protein kinase [Acidobacteriota bacterium]
MSPEASPSLPALPELGIYRVDALIGQGGMGEVYLAWDGLLERRVAIKRVRTERLGDQAQRHRFLREARAVARLDHPSVVRVYHVLERDESHCLVMEYVEGRSLRAVLGDGLVSWAEAATYGSEIAAGLAAAHDQGLVHRDLKPANVMVLDSPGARGAPGRVKILDFGLAKTFDGPKEDDELTRSDMIVGTAHAMSPEQACGRPVNHRSDLFALGSLLYEMISGRAPFRGVNPMDSLQRVVNVEPPPLGRILPRMPTAFADLVDELLSKEPEDRPASAHRVAERLRLIASSVERASADDVADPDSATAELHPVRSTAVDAPPSPRGPVLRTVVQVRGEAGDEAVSSPTDIAVGLLPRFTARRAGDFFLFERPAEGVAFALVLHRAAAEEGLEARLGLHLGEVDLEPAGAAAGETLRVARALCRRARPRQTLLGRSVFDLVRGAHSPDVLTDPRIRWLAHGRYHLDGSDDPLEIFEVGMEGFAPLVEPPDSGRTLRATASSGAEPTLGWRPAAGQGVPRRANWKLEHRLGEGSFGEVWLARHPSGEERVFKFCFEVEKLRSLKREVTLFRLMREALGHRRDIVRLLDWDLEEAPYFLESEYGDDLVRWAERRGGVEAVPLETRLTLAAGIAEALAAAHSVGVLHKDVKPNNILMNHDGDGRPFARLADFGIGWLTEAGKTRSAITVSGLTETSTDEPRGGTVRYMAPELLAGQPATVQADVYALGVTLYQLVIADFERALAPGWRREIDDELLVEDIAACVDGSPERRLRDPAALAERLRRLPERRLARRREELARAAAARADRRRQVLSTLGVAAALMTVLIAVFAFQAFQAKNRELEARKSADQRRHQAEALIDFMLGDLRAELQPLGKLDLLDQVGEQAMEYFAAVPEEELSDEETASYAKALDQIGQVRFALGEMEESARAFRRSLAMTEALAARRPADSDVRFQLGQSHFWVGYAHWHSRDLDAAVEHFEAYRDLSEKLVEGDPENLTWQRELAYSYSNLGQAFEEQGRLPEAALALEANARILEGLALKQPARAALKDALASAYAKLGRLAESRGELRQSRQRHESALDILTRAVAAHPGHLELQVSRNSALFHLGEILHKVGDSAASLRSFREALELSRRLVDHEPDNRSWRLALALDLTQTAMLSLAVDDLDGAARLAREGADLVESLQRHHPPSEQVRSIGARLRWLNASLALRQGRAAAAVPELRAAALAFRELDRGSTSRRHGYWRVKAFEALGAAYRQAGDGARASEAWGESLGAARELAAAEPTPDHLALLAGLLVQTGGRAEAEPLIERLAAMGYRRPSYTALLPSDGS